MLWCVAGFGIATIVFGLSKNFWLSLAALGLTGAFDMVSMMIRHVLVQLGTPDGMVAAWLGAEASVVLGGIVTLVVVGIWALAFPALRRFDRLGASDVLSAS